MKFLKNMAISILIAITLIPIWLWVLRRTAFFVIFLVALPVILITPLRLLFGGKAFPNEWMTTNAIIIIFSYIGTLFVGSMIFGAIKFFAEFIGVIESKIQPYAAFAFLAVGIFMLVTITHVIVDTELDVEK